MGLVIYITIKAQTLISPRSIEGLWRNLIIYVNYYQKYKSHYFIYNFIFTLKLFNYL